MAAAVLSVHGPAVAAHCDTAPVPALRRCDPSRFDPVRQTVYAVLQLRDPHIRVRQVRDFPRTDPARSSKAAACSIPAAPADLPSCRRAACGYMELQGRPVLPTGILVHRATAGS